MRGDDTPAGDALSAAQGQAITATNRGPRNPSPIPRVRVRGNDGKPPRRG